MDKLNSLANQAAVALSAQDTLHDKPVRQVSITHVYSIPRSLSSDHHWTKAMFREQIVSRASSDQQLDALIADQSKWSQATFGTDHERGPIGALKHLAKECGEVIQAVQEEDRDEALKELADCLILLLDATRRAGFSFKHHLVHAATSKMAENKTRQWQKPTKGDEPVEHVRDGETADLKLMSVDELRKHFDQLRARLSVALASLTGQERDGFVAWRAGMIELANDIRDHAENPRPANEDAKGYGQFLAAALLGRINQLPDLGK